MTRSRHGVRAERNLISLRQFTKVEERKLLFYYNIRSEHGNDIDGEGMDLPSLDGARSEALRAAREMVDQMIIHDQQIDGMAFDIVDKRGRRLETVRFRDVIRI